MVYGIREYALAIGITLLQLVIAVVLFRRNMHREFPVFFVYVWYHFFQGVIETLEMFLRTSKPTYFYTYYTLQIFSLALSFCVIYEVFSAVLSPYDALSHVWRKLFGTASMVLCIAGVAWMLWGQAADTYRFLGIFYLIERSLRVIQLGLIVFLFALSSAFGMSWRNYAFGIALGYGVYAAVDLLLVAMRTEYGQAVIPLQALATTLAYGVGNTIWMLYAFQAKKPAAILRVIPHNDIAKWNEKLEELLKRKAA